MGEDHPKILSLGKALLFPFKFYKIISYSNAPLKGVMGSQDFVKSNVFDSQMITYLNQFIFFSESRRYVPPMKLFKIK